MQEYTYICSILRRSAKPDMFRHVRTQQHATLAHRINTCHHYRVRYFGHVVHASMWRSKLSHDKFDMLHDLEDAGYMHVNVHRESTELPPNANPDPQALLQPCLASEPLNPKP